MEEISDKLELKALRLGGGSSSFKSTLSGRSTPRNSPTFRKAHSSRTPRREARGGASGAQWLRSNRVLFWLLLITLWTYLGFFIQSRWAHSNDKDNFLGGNQLNNRNEEVEHNPRRDLIDPDISLAVKNGTGDDQIGGKRMDVVLAGKHNGVSPQRKLDSKKKKPRRGGKVHVKPKTTIMAVRTPEVEEQEPDIPRTNTTYGMLVGPFALLEDKILEWSPEKRSGTCDRKGDFARLVWSRRFLLIFHELSMTGAPLSMMELATELLSCGATVSAVVLSKRGGLMSELTRRKIKVLEDKAKFSFKTAMKADLVIAGSAVCSSWIDQYMDHYPAGASQIAWWIMENRREYFDRAKIVLDRVKMLVFISESQKQQWLTWIEEENIKLRSQPALVPLSINDEMAFVAGISCTLNTPSFTTEKMMEKKQLLRNSTRDEMGLTDKDLLVISLSSVNPGKGQLLLLESGRLVIEKEPQQNKSKIETSVKPKLRRSALAKRHRLRGLVRKTNYSGNLSNDLELAILKTPDKMLMLNQPLFVGAGSLGNNVTYTNNTGEVQDMSLKILIGSVGSKSNKVVYVKEILDFLSNHSSLSKSVMWTPSTTRVAALYSAADVYVINSQGLGETFGRVTIEAMAFGLPVLGTEAGGTKEIVEHNVTGLLHPVGRPGSTVLAENLRSVLKNELARKEMGKMGREKVKKMYLKRHMYKRFVDVLTKCMRTK